MNICQAFAESANTAIGRHQSSNRRIGDAEIHNDVDDADADGDDFNHHSVENH